MSTPEQPATPALTRKQLRDIRNTGATPIVSADDAEAHLEDPASGVVAAEIPEAETVEVTDAGTPEPAPVPVVAPLPRAAVPAVVHDLPGTDASVDLGVAPLTRRQARQQERIRTASVPVITPEVAAAHAAAQGAQQPTVEGDPGHEPAEDAVQPAEVVDADGASFDAEVAADEHDDDAEINSPDETAVEPDSVVELEQIIDPSSQAGASADEGDRAVVNPQFGAGLLAGDVAQVELPPSFDQLISRSMTGAVGTGNALILSQAPSEAPLVAPVTATGEVLITGTFNLPEGLGSTGHAVGTADGKEVDAVLVDGELPAHSSPTPIAASAAISTVKNGGDIIRPPAPEKGSRLMLTLAITAGVLALALVGVLILAFVTGVF